MEHSLHIPNDSSSVEPTADMLVSTMEFIFESHGIGGELFLTENEPDFTPKEHYAD